MIENSSISSHEELEAQLRKLLAEVSQGKVEVSAAQSTAPLKSLGLDSVLLLGFLVAIEDLLGFEWPTEVPKETFSSISSIATFVEKARA